MGGRSSCLKYEHDSCDQALTQGGADPGRREKEENNESETAQQRVVAEFYDAADDAAPLNRLSAFCQLVAKKCESLEAT